MFMIGASRIAGKEFSSPSKMHYRPEKGGRASAQRGRSMLSTIAVFDLYSLIAFLSEQWFVILENL